MKQYFEKLSNILVYVKKNSQNMKHQFLENVPL